MNGISGVVLTKNEEKNIKDCLSSIDFCSEVIVVDDFSNDKTVKIAESVGAKVFRRHMNTDYASQSNFGLEKAKGNWVVFLDADERIGKELKNEIVCHIKNDKDVSGYLFKRSDFMWGRFLRHGEAGTMKIIRMIKKGDGMWRRRVHSNFTVKGKIFLLNNPITHYPHASVFEFVKSTNRWSSWHAVANAEEGKKSSLLKIFFWPSLHFLKNYILKFGFLDGIPGLIFAVMMSFHSFLAWGKMWMREKGYEYI